MALFCSHDLSASEVGFQHKPPSPRPVRNLRVTQNRHAISTSSKHTQDSDVNAELFDVFLQVPGGRETAWVHPGRALCIGDDGADKLMPRGF